jgi:hypothetical protein
MSKLKKENILLLRFFFSHKMVMSQILGTKNFQPHNHNICKANTLAMLFGMGIISLSQKWWQINFRNKIYMQPMRGLNRYYALQEGSISWKGGLALFIYLFIFWGGVGGCSHMFLMMFPKFSMCSPSLFSITPHVYPIHFAQSSPLLTYLGGGHRGWHYIFK